MPLNLITDSWIPVVCNGEQVSICPHEIARDYVERLDWPRDDLNLGCLEFLIGLIYIADPPRDDSDWHARYNKPDPDRLQQALEIYSRSFELTGKGPRFLQDLDPLEIHASSDNFKPPDMLFIDSAGALTIRKNSDLMVKRNRYSKIELPLAAISLYTLQAFAPTGGAGNLTSMRGGGPMVTLMKPINGGMYPLWKLVWGNVPEGRPLCPNKVSRALPWLRPTRTSENGQVVIPEMSHPAEAFFGMPRRLRLIFDGDAVTGVVQQKHGTNYKGWEHPLSPHYCKEVGGERLAMHPKPGRVSYQNWLGLSFGEDGERRFVAKTVRRFRKLADAPASELYVGGWTMSNMKPRDFSLHTYPTFRLDNDMEMRATQLVEAANSVANKLIKSLKDTVTLKGNAAEAVQEGFFADSEQGFVISVQAVADGQGLEVEESWIRELRQTALAIFDRHTRSALSDRNMADIEKTVIARRTLLAHFSKGSGVRKIFPDLLSVRSNST